MAKAFTGSSLEDFESFARNLPPKKATEEASALVNEKPDVANMSQSQALDFLTKETEYVPPTRNQMITEQVRAQQIENTMPQGWLGELGHGLGRGIDQLQG